MSGNNNIEKYIKSLSPELQEKINTCKNLNEMMDLAAREGIELPDEALDFVTGGARDASACSEPDAKTFMCCPKCKNTNKKIYSINSAYGQAVSGIVKLNSLRYNTPISNYIIDCTTCNLLLFAVSKGNIC